METATDRKPGGVLSGLPPDFARMEAMLEEPTGRNDNRILIIRIMSGLAVLQRRVWFGSDAAALDKDAKRLG